MATLCQRCGRFVEYDSPRADVCCICCDILRGRRTVEETTEVAEETEVKKTRLEICQEKINKAQALERCPHSDGAFGALMAALIGGIVLVFLSVAFAGNPADHSAKIARDANILIRNNYNGMKQSIEQINAKNGEMELPEGKSFMQDDGDIIFGELASVIQDDWNVVFEELDASINTGILADIYYDSILKHGFNENGSVSVTYVLSSNKGSLSFDVATPNRGKMMRNARIWKDIQNPPDLIKGTIPAFAICGLIFCCLGGGFFANRYVDYRRDQAQREYNAEHSRLMRMAASRQE